MTDLWPIDLLPADEAFELPEQILRDQALSLASHTSGRVRAGLRKHVPSFRYQPPIFDDDGEEIEQESVDPGVVFSLYLVATDGAEHRLLRVGHRSDVEYPCWMRLEGGEPKFAASSTELKRLLRDAFATPAVRGAVISWVARSERALREKS